MHFISRFFCRFYVVGTCFVLLRSFFLFIEHEQNLDVSHLVRHVILLKLENPRLEYLWLSEITSRVSCFILIHF